MYMEVPSREGCRTARYISPRFPRRNIGQAKCLTFSYNIFGKHGGQISVLDEQAKRLWRYTYNFETGEGSRWLSAFVTMGTNQTLFAIEAHQLGQRLEDEAEICVDNLLVLPLSCDG